MINTLPAEHLAFAIRLRDIERELATLRREQRLFRRVGFGENLKALQIVALQVEQRELMAIVRPDARAWEHDERFVTVMKVLRNGATVAGLAATIALATTRIAARTYARAVTVRGTLRSTPVPSAPFTADALPLSVTRISSRHHRRIRSAIAS